jgi:GNAT superfamily N-acetyltransferase/predicted Rdx family selenoprotein
MEMKIVDLTPSTIDDSISLCIGSKPGFEQAREEKRRWLEGRLPNRVGTKLAYFDGSLAGMVEYSPIEDTPFPVVGKHLLHIHCVWVLPTFQKKGLGEELVKSVVNEARSRGRKGVSVIAHDGAFFMPISFFASQKFRTVDRRSHSELMWRMLEDAEPPKFIWSRFSPTEAPDRVTVDVLYCSQCPWTIKSRERMTRISREFGNDVKIRALRTDDRKVMENLGDLKGVYVNGQDFFFAATEDDIRKMLAAKTGLLHDTVGQARQNQIRNHSHISEPPKLEAITQQGRPKRPA